MNDLQLIFKASADNLLSVNKPICHGLQKSFIDSSLIES